MTFTVKYRGVDGAVRTEAVEATSRADCLSQMKARGVAVLGVMEGRSSTTKYTKKDGNGRVERADRVEAGRGKDGRAGARPSRIAYVLLIAFIALAGGGVWWWMRSPRSATLPEEDGPKKASALAKEVKPAAAPKPESAPAAVTNAPGQKAETVPKKKMTREERMEMIEKKISETPIDLCTRTNRAFRTGLEQTLAAIFTTQLGAPPPPLPLRLTPVTYVHLESILNAPNEILDTDSEKVVEAKMACAAAKKMLKEHIDSGGDPEKFLEAYYSHLKQSHEEWKAAQRTLLETMKNDPGLAPTMEAEVNENFKSRGMRPIKMPPKLKERYGIQ